MAAGSTIAMSRVDEVLRAAESLQPDDRLRLIARLWATLPPNHWAAPSDVQLAEIRRHFGEPDADPVHESAWEALRRLLKPESEGEQPGLYAATRRFDLATIFIAMAVYSVLLAGMSVLQFHPSAKIYLGVFVVVVAIGQAFLEPFVDARRASIFVGAGFHTLCSLIFWITLTGGPPVFSFILIVLINGLIGGATMGYMAGALVGGVYLIADVIRGKFGYAASDDPTTSTIENAPPAPTHPLDNVVSPGS
jgi:putative addiction module component (TIGR02574 family)